MQRSNLLGLLAGTALAVLLAGCAPAEGAAAATAQPTAPAPTINTSN